MCDEVRLVRYDQGETPWGFRITGGRDFGTPLLVVKVVGGSIAALSGVTVGDLIRGINYVPTNDFTHLDAQRAILQSGDTLILNLLKGGEYEPPEIPVIDIQSPEDKEVEEIAQQEDLESAFVVKLNRSGRISAVEEIPTPNVTPSTTPELRRASSSSSGGEKRRKSSGGSTSSHSEKTTEEVEKKSKPKISITMNDSGPINIQPPSYEDATKSKTESKKGSSKQQEVTLTEEMRVETSVKKTTTEIKERTEEEFVMGVRDEILSRAHNENRELTEEEIAEMMAGEAEVIEAPTGKEVIGVNFQKFIPKCDFIKDSEVFKALQEEQIKKERTEEQQLAKDPLKRFSKFLIKPKTEKPIPKPKPIHVDPMPWQERLNSPSVATDTNTKTSLTQSSATEKTNEIRKESLKIENESKIKENLEQTEESEATESVSVSTVQESEEKLTMRIGKSEKEECNEVVTNNEDDLYQQQEDKNDVDEEIEDIELKAEKKDKRKDSSEVSQKKSSLATEEGGRRSKNKKVAFVGLEFKEDIEKQLSEIQKELLTLQRLPIEIQNHLLVVQQTLQDIVAQRMQSPTNGDDEIEDTEKINNEDESIGKTTTDEDDVEKEEDKKESIDEEVDEQNVKKSDEEEASVKITEEKAIEESEDVDINKTTTTTENESTSEEVIKENETVEEKKDLPPGQEDVEICESKVKPALPLTPQMRPLVLPGGRKWHQPKDAYTEEYIAETLVSQSEVLIGTTIGVNFRKYIPPKFDESNSAVYRLIHEIEDKQKKGIAERAKKGVAERPGKVPGLDEFYHPPIDKRHFFAAQLAEKKHVDNLHPQPGAPGHY